ncbi:helix-turn-helix domain-containing protein [Virgibacillus sp. C22-A2]|uniref:Helix-turn-helix domain-containing protein n=1 Tax=Virgibacillus tibetensis TaxID=3042313 RepID=A0ABU6KG57_9BACI|nr:helix-turn-helix domain-containing protein [Virgibacillus sp. C22-A2]
MGSIANEGQKEGRYYTLSEAARKLGLSDQTIRLMCERGKFKGARLIGRNGQWRIPNENFITKREQDEDAENILRQIEKRNEKAGDIDEFDL